MRPSSASHERLEAEDAELLVVLLDLEVMGRDLGVGHRGRPDHRGRPLLDLPARAHHAAGPATDQVARLEMLVNRRQDPLAVTQVGSPGEHQAQVAGRIQRPGGFPGGIRERLDRVEALGKAHGDPDGHA